MQLRLASSLLTAPANSEIDYDTAVKPKDRSSQLWLASSLLADALAVAAQSLMAKAIAAGDRATARFVARRSLGLGLLLGVRPPHLLNVSPVSKW